VTVSKNRACHLDDETGRDTHLFFFHRTPYREKGNVLAQVTIYMSEALMKSTPMMHPGAIEQFFDNARRQIQADLDADRRVRPLRIGIQYDVASYHALGCANWSHLRTGAIKPVEQMPAWHAFQVWLASRHLQASWTFCCDKAGVQSWWELTITPMRKA
jgi:hypothetical protein